MPVPPQVLEAQKLTTDFFNSERVELILQQLITQFMLLTSEVYIQCYNNVILMIFLKGFRKMGRQS